MPADALLVQAVINHLTGVVSFDQPANLYVALFVDAGMLTEASGGSYARQIVTFPTASSNAVSNSGTVTFSGLSAGSYYGIGLYDDTSGSSRYLYAYFPSVITVSAGDSLTFAAAQLIISGS